MKKKISLIFIILVVFLSGCFNESKSIKSENEQLKTKISQLENELRDKNSKISELQNNIIQSININYIENISSKMFIEKKCDLFALPIENAPKLNTINENTVITVLDTAEVNNIIWLYVSIPVYDTPSNYKGWIKRSDSIFYTKDIMTKVQSDVKVKEGEYIYETTNFDDIKLIEPYKANKENGRIVEKKDGYVRINCPGGKTIWVKETSIVYPEVDL